MIKNILLLLFISCFMLPVFAQGSNDLLTTTEVLESIHPANSTSCASKIFSKALLDHSEEIKESDPEFKVRAWAHETMTGDAAVLKELLSCPEIQNADDYKTIIFDPIVYEFPGGRTITVNYSTQPKVLKQKLMLTNKRSLPNGDANPNIMDVSDGAKYLNTEPAWYAIMVVQHDSLKDFVGPGKNNTLSMKYLDDNIGKIYPRGYNCTSKSAWANDTDMINIVTRRVVDIENDSNDYYVAGDVNLEWVMYAEIAADIILAVFTGGASEVAMFELKSIRVFKAGKGVLKSMYELAKIPDVAKYVTKAKQIAQHTDDIAKLEKNIENAKKYEKVIEKIEKARKAGRDTTKYEKEAEEILNAARKIDPKITEKALDLTEPQIKSLTDIDKNIARYEKQIADLQGKNPSKARELRTKITNQKYARNKILNQAGNKNPAKKLDANKLREEQKKLQESIKTLEKEADNLVDASKDVKKYKEQAETYKDLHKYFKNLRGIRRPQTGNAIVKTLKGLRAINKGEKTMNKAAKVARAGMSSRSAKIKYWLTDATLKHGARLARVERDLGLAYGAITLIGEMWDRTSSTSKEFSNGIEFKPLCLLSADDLKGQENVVNYGMWLMWVGNSTDAADDDAAYLQAMDFASKFFYELDEIQDTYNVPFCNVDIYVVRPIIKLDETNMDDPKGELFYLFMNEIPWSTAEQFNGKVHDIEDWERVQQDLEIQDPKNKYKKVADAVAGEIQEQFSTEETPDSQTENTTE